MDETLLATPVILPAGRARWCSLGSASVLLRTESPTTRRIWLRATAVMKQQVVHQHWVLRREVGGRGVVDLDIAGRFALASRHALGANLFSRNGGGRGRRGSRDRYGGSARRQQWCDVGQLDSHGDAPSMDGPNLEWF